MWNSIVISFNVNAFLLFVNNVIHNDVIQEIVLFNSLHSVSDIVICYNWNIKYSVQNYGQDEIIYIQW